MAFVVLLPATAKDEAWEEVVEPARVATLAVVVAAAVVAVAGIVWESPQTGTLQLRITRHRALFL